MGVTEGEGGSSSPSPFEAGITASLGRQMSDQEFEGAGFGEGRGFGVIVGAFVAFVAFVAVAIEAVAGIVEVNRKLWVRGFEVADVLQRD